MRKVYQILAPAFPLAPRQLSAAVSVFSVRRGNGHRRAGSPALPRAPAGAHAAGFGRTGATFWAFERYGVVPDLVVLGKPIANGYPMGAVVTPPEIAASFANGMELFSTFGGSTAACAAALTTLEVLEEEGLQRNAAAVGARTLGGLAAFADHMRDRGILLGTDGPFYNVLKIRPPHCFTAADADLLVATLDAELAEDPGCQ